MAIETLRHPTIEPSHPGELLNEIVIPGTGRTKVEIAGLLGISQQTLSDLLSCKAAVTPELAFRLGEVFGNGATLWLEMQNAYDLWHAERAVHAGQGFRPDFIRRGWRCECVENGGRQIHTKCEFGTHGLSSLNELLRSRLPHPELGFDPRQKSAVPELPLDLDQVAPDLDNVLRCTRHAKLDPS